jgi:putative ABC transport system permease protein
MSFLSAIRVALGALLVNKGRSMLTSLGIVIGIGAVIAMVAAGSGARSMLDDRLESVGKNLIIVKPGARSQTGTGVTVDSTPLTADDAAAIRKGVRSWVVGVAESQMAQRMASTAYANHMTFLVGSTPDLQPVRQWHMTYGRFYNDEDVRSSAPVCLIGQVVKQKLFPGLEDPVGQKVRVGMVELRVIGVLGPKGRMPTGVDQDDQIFLPITTMEHRITGSNLIALIITSTRSDKMVEPIKEQIVRLMRERHHLKPEQADDFDVSTVQEMSELALVVTTIMQGLIATIASISLVVGGIGIMNIMLVSVTERTREIGIRMAIGATPGDVLTQFLIEAVVLALVGGVIGITLGIAGAVTVAMVMDWPLVVEPQFVGLAFAVAAGVGIFFGYYPARKASRLDPIEALRYE